MSDQTFSAAEREDFYLEILGDAFYEGPQLHEPLWWANTRFQSADARGSLVFAMTASQLTQRALVIKAECRTSRMIHGRG